MEFLWVEGKTIYAGNSPVLLRGFGLGGWFLPEGYMWKLYKKCDRPRRMEAMIAGLCGEAYAKQFWHRYFDSYITEDDIKLIASEGFNSIRLPLNARHLLGKRNDRLILLPEMLHRLDRCIEWCGKYHIYVILDMHAAPGGQTGQNIDDSEADLPYLFMDAKYIEELSFLWKSLAERYRKEPVIAGYDLLNEPVPKFFSEYNSGVLPLYRRLIREIREIDDKHMLILEGVHWATDFSIFDPFTREEAADNIVLQFHKYWSNPDAESLTEYIEASERLQVPLFMGEGGENNNEWYTTIFPLYEQLNISWSFWVYKKMDCANSPLTFDVPDGWEELLEWIDKKGGLDTKRAVQIFDNFITCIQNSRVNQEVFNALGRKSPVKIPCEAYNACRILSKRVRGARLREQEPVSIVFASGKAGDVDYKRYGGEEQPEDENLLIILSAGDRAGYLFYSEKEAISIKIAMSGGGTLSVATATDCSGIYSCGHSGDNTLDDTLLIDTEPDKIWIDKKSVIVKGFSEYTVALSSTPGQKQYLWLVCDSGYVKADNITIA